MKLSSITLSNSQIHVIQSVILNQNASPVGYFRIRYDGFFTYLAIGRNNVLEEITGNTIPEDCILRGLYYLIMD